MQQQIGLNSIYFYVLLYAGTVLYYLKAYSSSPVSNPTDKRAKWYFKNIRNIRWVKAVMFLIIVAAACYACMTYGKRALSLSPIQYGLLFIFPLAAVLYYGFSFPGIRPLNLREAGWIKPFVIGFVWSGAVTVYPVILKQIESDTIYTYSYLNGIFFIKNWMFITVLCIMFDIKDYAADHNLHLKTFVVRVGLRKTIFSIIIPLVLIGFSAFIVTVIYRRFPVPFILINSIPFIMLIVVAWSLHQRKPILYYLAIIDGQMLVKAACGISAALLIKSPY